MTRRRVILAGKKFGKLTVGSKWRPTGRFLEWLCKCSCGGEVWIRGDNLSGGKTKSCGACGKSNAELSENAVAS